MKLTELYQFLVEKGIESDPRGEGTVRQELDRENKLYTKLSPEEKEVYDTERLTNPYIDTRVLNNTTEDIKSILVGVDLETPEVLLAHQLNQQGKQINLLMSHHPEGFAYANFYQVMSMQADIFSRFGVPINCGETLTQMRMKEVGRRVLPQNHTRAVDAAKLLNFAFLSVHTPADNQVTSYLQNIFDQRNPVRIDDVLNILKSIPEYKKATLNGQGPKILIGDKDKRTGKIFVDMTGGTEGSVEILERLAYAGVGTIIGMHMSEDHFKTADKFHLNVVIAGHIPSDTLGINLILDKVEQHFSLLDIVSCSGFERFRRNTP